MKKEYPVRKGNKKFSAPSPKSQIGERWVRKLWGNLEGGGGVWDSDRPPPLICHLRVLAPVDHSNLESSIDKMQRGLTEAMEGLGEP